MNKASIFFCAPDFVKALKAAFPDSQVIPFSSTVDGCRDQIASLDDQNKPGVWILYQAIDNSQQNQIVKDHINLSPENPLIGPVDLSKGPRFPDMSSVYEDHNYSGGVVVVLGNDPVLENFEEPWSPVSEGVWEAIALKHRGYKIHGWLIADLEKWMNDLFVV